MKRKEAMELFGCDTQVGLARKLGLTKGAVCNWGDDLPKSVELIILGAAAKKRIQIPEKFLEENT